jgi:5'-nucleotidase
LVAIVLGILVAGLSNPVIAAGPSKCTDKKIKTAGKKVSGKANCVAKAVSKGLTVDPACLSKEDGKFTSAFIKAEDKGDCLADTGDEATVGAFLDAQVDTIACDLGADCAHVPAIADPLRVLVTNDDGVAAAGIDVMVQQLALNPNLQITVVAPATNQSGTGDSVTTTSITAASTTTASGFPATSVAAFPADAVLFGILEVLAESPDLVVSGINFGQNIAEFVELSGTVGAASWAARKGIPAIAVSQGVGDPISYSEAAEYVADLVERFRTDPGFRNRMYESRAPFHGVVLNVNFPTCTSGSTRGVRVVPTGISSEITGYTGGPSTWTPTVTSTNAFLSNCTSALSDPTTDLEAMTNGLASVTPLSADRSASTRDLSQFLFLEQ